MSEWSEAQRVFNRSLGICWSTDEVDSVDWWKLSQSWEQAESDEHRLKFPRVVNGYDVDTDAAFYWSNTIITSTNSHLLIWIEFLY